MDEQERSTSLRGDAKLLLGTTGGTLGRGLFYAFCLLAFVLSIWAYIFLTSSFGDRIYAFLYRMLYGASDRYLVISRGSEITFSSCFMFAPLFVLPLIVYYVRKKNFTKEQLNAAHRAMKPVFITLSVLAFFAIWSLFPYCVLFEDKLKVRTAFGHRYEVAYADIRVLEMHNKYSRGYKGRIAIQPEITLVTRTKNRVKLNIEIEEFWRFVFLAPDFVKCYGSHGFATSQSQLRSGPTSLEVVGAYVQEFSEIYKLPIPKNCAWLVDPQMPVLEIEE